MSLNLHGHHSGALSKAGEREKSAGLVFSRCSLSLLEAWLVFIKQLQLKPLYLWCHCSQASRAAALSLYTINPVESGDLRRSDVYGQSDIRNMTDFCLIWRNCKSVLQVFIYNKLIYCRLRSL